MALLFFFITVMSRSYIFAVTNLTVTFTFYILKLIVI